MREIPDIQFFNKKRNDIEIETMTLQGLFSRRHQLKNSLENEHRVHFYHIHLITKGEGVHRIDFQPYPYSEGSLIFISKGQIHAFDPDFSSEGILLVFTEKFLIQNVIPSDTLFLHRLFNYHLHTPVIQSDEQERENIKSLINEMHSEYHSSEEFAKKEILHSQLKLLLLKIERIKQRNMISKSSDARVINPNWIDIFTNFNAFIQNNHATTRNAQDYAAWLKISPKHLNEICKSVTGKTSKQFIDAYLILEIKRNLSISTMSVKELTYKFGFDEPTNFLKYFKKHTGQTPVQFKSALSARTSG